MDALFWQVCIVIGIVWTALLFGRRGFYIAVLISVVWTIAMIFTTWLFVLQLFTISLALNLGLKLLKGPKLRERVAKARVWTGGAIGLGVIASILIVIVHQEAPPLSLPSSSSTSIAIATASPSSPPVLYGTIYSCDDGKGSVRLTGALSTPSETPPGCKVYVNGSPIPPAVQHHDSDPALVGYEDVMDPATKAAMDRACADLNTPHYNCATGLMR